MKATTPNQIRLKTLEACGWDRETAKRYIRRHKHPRYMVEWIVLGLWDIKKYFRGQ